METAVETPFVMEKVFNILKKELSVDEYVMYLQAITPRIGDATAQLRDATKQMSFKEVLDKAKQMEVPLKHGNKLHA